MYDPSDKDRSYYYQCYMSDAGFLKKVSRIKELATVAVNQASSTKGRDIQRLASEPPGGVSGTGKSQLQVKMK